MNEYNLTLDLAKAKQRQQQTIFVRQGDTNGTTIVATITDHGVAASTSGLTARFQMRLPDGTHYYRKAASLSGNVATVTIDEAQAASVVGRTDTAYFQLLQGSTVVASTESFTVVVLPDALADATVSESYDSAIQDAIDALDAAVADLPSTVEDVLADHPEWTTTVQDGSITTDKLADEAVTAEKLADNAATTATASGSIATTGHAITDMPFRRITIYGASEQSGTPTPAAPVAIESIESLSVRVSGSYTSDYTTTAIDLAGNILRSLPDGTADALTIASDGTVTLTKRVGVVNLGTFDWASLSSPESHVFRTIPGLTNIVKPATNNYAVNAISDGYVAKAYAPLSASDDGCFALTEVGDRLVFIDSRFSDVESFAAAASSFVMHYQLATPVTVELGSVSAIYPPEQVSNVWAVSDPAASVSVTYLQNTAERLSEIDADIDEVRQVSVCKNLVGNESGVYYPVPELHEGDVVTLSNADGEARRNETLVVFYDKDKTRLDYWAFKVGQTTRTITLPAVDDGTVYISATSPDPEQPFQLEVGSSATEYVPYFGNAKYTYDIAVSTTPQSISDSSFNAAYHTGAKDFATKCQQFSALMYGDSIADVSAPTDCESFLFFTDPHFSTGATCQEYIAQIQKYYNSTPTTFCLCGGDWLNSGDTPAQACFKLGYIDGFMHSMFDNCHMLVGNHDTNYQGKLTSESATYTTRLSEQSIIDLWYRGGKAHYEFDGASTRFFCFNTGTEAQSLSSYGNYGYEQAQWFADKLTTNTATHVAIALHILWWDDITNRSVQPLAQLVLDIAKAFNDRGSITINGTSYSFANASGKVEFLITGHTHRDAETTINGIPCIMSDDVQRDNSYGPTFDLVLVDYSNSVIKMVRVGYGQDRTIALG